MKTILNLCCAASFACLVCFAASSFVPSLPATRLPPASDAAFTSHTRSKALQYFDTYRADPLGLPATCAARVKAREIPASWKSGGIPRGLVVPENDRSALVNAPLELTRVLPADSKSVRYYLAGRNLVAVNERFKVLDSVCIPTVHLPRDGEAQSVQWVRNVGSSYR